MKKKYRLLIESPELIKGAILEEKCTDGTQDFIAISGVKFKNPSIEIIYDRKVVMTQPKYFEEIILVEVPKKSLAKVSKFIHNLR